MSKALIVKKMEQQSGTRRDRKKAKLRAELVEAAISLFKDNGFEKTRIEDIAAAVDVAVATVYNYFSTKQQILVEIVSKTTDDAEPAVLAIVENPPKNPVDAVLSLIKTDFGNLDDKADKKLWRELLASMNRDQENRERIEEIRGRFRGSLRQLIKALVHKRQLAASADIEALVDISYAIYAYHFRQLVCIDRMTTAHTLKLIRRDVKALFSGFLMTV